MRTRVLALALWLAVVLACSTGVWAVIRTAGGEVTTSPALPATPADAATSPTAPPTASAGASPSRAHHPRRHPTTPAPGAPTPAPATVAPTSTPPTAAPPAPASSSRTWQGGPGTVVVSCTGDAVRLTGATPSTGWRVEVGSRGPGQVEVQFAKGEDGQEVQVQSSCTAGSIHFRAQGD